MFIYTSQNMGLCNFYFVIVYNEPAIKLYYKNIIIIIIIRLNLAL